LISKESKKLFNQILNIAKDEIEMAEGSLYFVYVPEYWRYSYKSFNKIEIQDKYKSKNEILDLVKKIGIKIIDLDQEMRLTKDPLKFYALRSYGHFNEKGYEFIARKILNK